MASRQSLCLAMVAVIACGGTEPEAHTLTTITVLLAAPTVIVGGTVQATTSGADQHGTPMSVVGPAWTSSNTDVATVSSSGLITGVGVGSAEIRAESGDALGSASITVNPVPVATVEVSGPGSGVVGEQVTFTAIARAADGSILSGRPFTWGVSDGTRATVTQDGVVTILAPGQVTITADCGGVEGTAVLTGTPAS